MAVPGDLERRSCSEAQLRTGSAPTDGQMVPLGAEHPHPRPKHTQGPEARVFSLPVAS